MKHQFKLHLMGILILVFCVSCGQSVKETIKPVVPGAANDQFERVAIVPFADHTPASSLTDPFRRNTLVTEALQDALYGAGYISVAQEDVVQYLVDRGVIYPSSGTSDSSGTAALERELAGEWTDQMKEELEAVISQTNRQSRGSKDRNTIALNRKTLTDMGCVLNADYIVRGRIIEYSTDQIDTFNPVRAGIIPVVFKSGQRTALGMAETELYEYVDEDSFVDYDSMRDLFWGAGGFFTGLIGEKQGRVPGTTVQIRVLVQDANTGDVIWLNRAEASAIPRSAYADPDTDALFAKAISKVVNSLVDDFANAAASGRFARTEKQGSFHEPEQGADMDASAVEMAAEKAERSAREAKDSAGQARDAADEGKGYAEQAEDAAGDAKDAVKRASAASVKSEKIFKKIIAK